MPWVPYWDDSFDQAADLAAMYHDGFRVMAGYVAGGSSSKWSSAARIAKWLAQGPDTGFLPLFEAGGKEPVNSPSLGDNHAKAARAGARARGIPDRTAISPAVDLNVTMAQERADLLPYFRAWCAADTCKPIAYVEEDAGDLLHQQGVSAGTFTPAARLWNDNPVLYTPINAPAHVLVTQEHNGKKLAGGTVDIGHIRTSAPIWWRPAQPPEDDMGTVSDIEPAALDDIASAVWNVPEGRRSRTMMQDIAAIYSSTAVIIDMLTNSAKVEAAMTAALASMPTGVQVTPAELQAALLGALKELAAPDDVPPVS